MLIPANNLRNLPNDEPERDRMDMVHQMYKDALGELFLAPISDSPQIILDLGTGTGIWAMECAECVNQKPCTHPTKQPWLTIDSSVPPNCIFEVDDFEEWNLPYKFDLIHGRELDGSISDCEKLCREAFDHLKPGGYFELKSLEHGFFSDDETHKKAIHAHEWQQHIIEGRNKLRKPFCGATICTQGMENAGFVNIKSQKFKLRTSDEDPALKRSRFQ
ncbi:hypothetical protein AJ78_03690 [Emergomyces pasteurianus Ep9510]|uniref:Methyltransferase domain-containing protein n=1 Tax=Emergomyces pasteurianus Ep9510 TaxID=1447872 RepID=A0A1J9PJ95_9EURO|nr:hypothetical protein AJ78_03690 [Emergomyces pasteurianus Ep9510]